MRAASWAAVSSRPQAEKISIDEQHRRNKEKIEDLGATCVMDLTVPGISRKIVLFEDACRAIPAYQELKNLVDNKEIDLLVFYTKSRLGRTIALCETVVAYCQANGVAVYDLAAPPSTLIAAEQARSAGDTITGAITSWRSQGELSEMWQRHRDGMIGRTKRGKMASHIPLGWRKVYDKDGNERLEIDESIAPVIKRIMELYVTGNAIIAIVDILNSQGYRNPSIAKSHNLNTWRPWTKSAIATILDRAWTYAGYAEINRRSASGRPYLRAKGGFPAIIDEELAKRVDTERKSKKHVRTSKKDQAHYIYSGLVGCGPCNYNMSIITHSTVVTLANGTIKSYPALRCAKCRRRITITRVRSALLQWFAQLLEPNTRLQLISDIESDEKTVLQSDVEHLEKRLSQIETARTRASNAMVEGLLDRKEYATQKLRLVAEEKQIRLTLGSLRKQVATLRNTEETEQALIDLAELGPQLLDAPATEQVNAWLRQNIDAIFDGNRMLHFSLK